MSSRNVLALVTAAIIGYVLLGRYPFPVADPIIAILAHEKPWIVQGLETGWRLMMFSTPFIFLSTIFSLIYIYVGEGRESKTALPPFPHPSDSEPLRVVVGELQHPRKFEQVEYPSWLSIPERGLYTGIAIFGSIGSGKTSCCMYPFAKQVLSWRARDGGARAAALVLEVKGDFCYKVQDILKESGRSEDYIDLSLDGLYCYNPLVSDIDEFSLAYSIGSLLNNLYGRGKEPFWQQAYVNLVKFVLLTHRVVDGYCTLYDIYLGVINPAVLKQKIEEGEQALAEQLEQAGSWLTISLDDYVNHPLIGHEGWEKSGSRMRLPYTVQAEEDIRGWGIAVSKEGGSPEDIASIEYRIEQLSSVRRWFDHDWMKIDAKLRTSVVEGISSFLSMFDSDPKLKRVFCPPRELYVAPSKEGRLRPLPKWEELIEHGKVVALNLPPEAVGLARVLGTILKLDFERSMLGRIQRMAKRPDRSYRPVLFLCDEYQAFATAGESDPTGDDKFFALSRQAKCIPIVATQSISSMRSALPGESWATLLQSFRNKIFLSVTDGATSKFASELCGQDEQTVVSHSTSESGQDARVGLFSGKLQSHKSSVTLNTNMTRQIRPIFQPKVFSELKNAQSVVLAYDGVNPQPPQICYLKPHYLDPNESYFDQVSAGKL